MGGTDEDEEGLALDVSLPSLLGPVFLPLRSLALAGAFLAEIGE